MHCRELRPSDETFLHFLPHISSFCFHLLAGSCRLKQIICFACSESPWNCFHIGRHERPSSPPHWSVILSVARNKEESNKRFDAESVSLAVPPTCSAPNAYFLHRQSLPYGRDLWYGNSKLRRLYWWSVKVNLHQPLIRLSLFVLNFHV